MFFTSAALWCGFFSEPRTYDSGPRYLTCRISLRKRHRVARASGSTLAHALTSLGTLSLVEGSADHLDLDANVELAPRLIGGKGPDFALLRQRQTGAVPQRKALSLRRWEKGCRDRRLAG